jgi:hypothetical protein
MAIKLSEDLTLDLIGFADKRDVILDEELLIALKDIYVMVFTFNNNDLIRLIERFASDLKKSFTDLVNSDFSEVTRRKKLKRVQMTHELYTKELNLYIKFFNNKCRTELMKSITNLANKLLQSLPFKFKVIKNIINFAYEKNIEYLNTELVELNYDRNSMKRIKKIKESDRTSLLVKNNLEGIKNMGELLDDIKKGFLVDRELSDKFNKVDSQISRMDKFNLENSNPLSVIIREILGNTNMSVEQKQLTIEKATLEYDRN